MTTIFIDTSALIARYLVADQYHATCLQHWGALATSTMKLVTTNHVLDETFTLLARRASYGFSAEKANLIYHSDLLQIIRPGLEDELSALNFFEKFSDQQVSFTDCLSFAVMKRLKIQTAFGFDRHFVHAGFKLY